LAAQELNNYMNWPEYFFRHVYLVASKSKDPRTKIGSVLVRDNRIIASGYNGFAAGVEDCEERYNNHGLKLKLVVHSEANSILQCALLGLSSKDAVLYTSGLPCHECSKSIIQAGISKVVIHKQWPNLIHSEKWVESCRISKMMLDEAEVEIEEFDGKLGLVGLLDGKEIEI